ncbi:MAG TPA: ComEC/Rec2 family competence protein [Planctomycetota bacterium]|nr:ComEC/Rec2 family competence protein [Planctomycetota bacterium]
MEPSRAPALLWGSLFALPTAAVAPVCLPAAAAMAAFGLLFASHGRHRWRLAGLCALPALLAAIPAPRAAMPPVRPGPVLVTGTVASVVRAPQLGTTSVLLDDGLHRQRLSFGEDFEVLPGDRLEALARAGEPAAPGLPAPLHGIATTVRVTAGPCSLRRAAGQLRRAFERQLLRLVPGENGATLATLVLGRDTRTSAELSAAHRDTGLSHLLAVSGAHAAMLAFLLGLTGRGRGRRLAAGRGRTISILMLLFAYAAITGNEPPVLRAVVTFALAAVATQLGRPCGLATGLLAPALVTCLLQPEALLGPSFLLSYAAVFGLAMAAGRGDDSRLWRWLLGPLWASSWATLLTAPLTLLFFGQLAPCTVLLTPLLAPLVAAMLLGGLTAALLGCCVPPLGDLLAAPLGWLCELYATLVRWADLLPGTPVHASVAPGAVALGLAALVAAFVLERRPDRRGVAAAAVLLSLPYFVPLTGQREPRLQLFAIGHGQSCLAETAAGRQIAVDCGSLQHPYLAAQLLTSALVRRRLDLLVVTHADSDHHNGVPALLQHLPIEHAILPACLGGTALDQTLRAHGTAVTLLQPGQALQPEPEVRVAAPWLPPGASDNDQSLWTSVQIGATSVLLTGDAEAPGTAAAIGQGLAVPCDVLVLPHHGRPNALADALLQRVHPRACLASATTADGDTSQGGSVRRFGADLWVTGQHGTITLCDDPARLCGSTGMRPLAPGLR